MTVVLDTSVLFAALNVREPDHAACAAALEQARPPLVLSPFVLAELDYLLLTRAGVDRELAFLDDVSEGAYEVATVTRADVQQARDVARRYRDLRIGIADASIVVLCERYDTCDVLTLDHRHFRSITVHDQPLRLLPHDSTGS